MTDNFDKEEIRKMVKEAAASLTLKEKLEVSCMLLLSATLSIALMVFAYSVAKSSNIF